MARDLRLILTQRCTHNCLYCHHEGMADQKEEALDAEDYSFIFQVAKETAGIGFVTLTGGEPLLREDIESIIKNLKIAGAKVKLITNGVLLDKCFGILPFVDDLRISLASLRKSRFEKIHGCTNLPKVISNIKAISHMPLNLRARLNVCIVRGINTSLDAIDEFLDFALDHGVNLSFIELLNGPKNLHYPALSFKSKLDKTSADFIGESDCRWIYHLKNHKKGILIELKRCPCTNVKITKNIDLYCRSENDFFISPSGKLKPCMMHHGGSIDLLEPIKERERNQLSLSLRQAVEQFGLNCPMV